MIALIILTSLILFFLIALIIGVVIFTVKYLLPQINNSLTISYINEDIMNETLNFENFILKDKELNDPTQATEYPLVKAYRTNILQFINAIKTINSAYTNKGE